MFSCNGLVGQTTSTYFSPKTSLGYPAARKRDLYGVFEPQGRVRVNVVERLLHRLPALSSAPLAFLLPFLAVGHGSWSHGRDQPFFRVYIGEGYLLVCPNGATVQPCTI
jgi:hypothetical protein